MITYWGHGFEMKNFLPRRVTPTSKKCIDYMTATEEHRIETLEITKTDHFALTAEQTFTLKKCKLTAPVKKRDS